LSEISSPFLVSSEISSIVISLIDNALAKESIGERGRAQARSRSVAANIDICLVSEKWYFFLQLQPGPTDLLMVVPRNDAIFPKLLYIPVSVATERLNSVVFAK
jgi:hypothetical protein